MTDNPLWYKDAVIYELYVRAFYDSNADGHGDLPGVIARLDYLKDLGVDCLWLLPTYPSPLKDDGYDIADYYDVISYYGALDDFKQLLEETRMIFLDTEDSNWAWDDQAGMYYWHRFYSSQPDLNYDNPAVREEMKNVMKFWIDMGIDGVRADDVP